MNFNPTKRQDILNIFVKTLPEQRDYSKFLTELLDENLH